MFYEAEISIPAMVSYEWLQKKKLDVCPRLNAQSMFEDEQFTTLYGEPWSKLVTPPPGKRARKSKCDSRFTSCEEKRMAYGNYCASNTRVEKAQGPARTEHINTLTARSGFHPADEFLGNFGREPQSSLWRAANFRNF